MQKSTDISTLLGILTALAMVCIAIYLGSTDGKGDVAGFFNVESILIVLGGTFFLTSACFSLSEVWNAQSLVARTTFYNSEDPANAASVSLKIADIARKKGILNLQNHEELMNHNPFLKKGINLIIDGISFEDADKILGREIAAIIERHKISSSILRKAAEIAPAMGLIGTLIGLVQMLANLSNPSSIGPAMAVALLTTLYGAALAFMIFMPLASKLERNSNKEALIMKIYKSAVVSIGKRENPHRLEILLNAILPPSQQIRYFE